MLILKPKEYAPDPHYRLGIFGTFSIPNEFAVNAVQWSNLDWQPK